MAHIRQELALRHIRRFRLTRQLSGFLSQLARFRGSQLQLLVRQGHIRIRSLKVCIHFSDPYRSVIVDPECKYDDTCKKRHFEPIGLPIHRNNRQSNISSRSIPYTATVGASHLKTIVAWRQISEASRAPRTGIDPFVMESIKPILVAYASPVSEIQQRELEGNVILFRRNFDAFRSSLAIPIEIPAMNVLGGFDYQSRGLEIPVGIEGVDLIESVFPAEIHDSIGSLKTGPRFEVAVDQPKILVVFQELVPIGNIPEDSCPRTEPNIPVRILASPDDYRL